jgi:hypothetical protein
MTQETFLVAQSSPTLVTEEIAIFCVLSLVKDKLREESKPFSTTSTPVHASEYTTT